jgi:hypothetical protein
MQKINLMANTNSPRNLLHSPRNLLHSPRNLLHTPNNLLHTPNNLLHGGRGQAQPKHDHDDRRVWQKTREAIEHRNEVAEVSEMGNANDPLKDIAETYMSFAS